MKQFIKMLEDKVLKEELINFKEAMKLTNVEKKDIGKLCKSANKIREDFCGNEVDLCTIMNAKSGHCSEDCKFCSQSAHYKTNIKVHGIVSKEDALKLARENENEGVNRFSLVTSGRGACKNELEHIIDIYKEVKNNTKIDLCASLGILDYKDLIRLKEEGVKMYHHNLETNRSYYENICTTHGYDERIHTINAAKDAGLEVCSGGIIGLGESIKDRLELAFELRSLNIKSIPINILNPIKGTPLENAESLSQEDILKTVSIFRFINPKAFIRLAGGRNQIENFGQKCFLAGANATITGNYLTTSGNKICDDKKMINDLKLKVRKNS